MVDSAKALELPSDDANTATAVVLKIAESHLAIPGNAKNPQVPTKAEADAALKAAHELLKTYGTAVTGDTAKKIDESTPKTPVVAEESETTAVEKKSGDWQSNEVNGFVTRAQKGVDG